MILPDVPLPGYYLPGYTLYYLLGLACLMGLLIGFLLGRFSKK